MHSPRFVLNTVGISLLLNSLSKAEEDWRKILNDEANAKVLRPESATKVEELKERTLANLATVDVKGQRRISAELNGIYGLYDGQLVQAKADHHYLVTTDTAMGRIAAEVLKRFLDRHVAVVEVYVPAGLSTATRDHFATGMKELIGWCEGIVPGYEASGYRVVFNLTGGFKSLQGYLTTIGMFYADEIIYIFETGSQALAIPRLPIQIDYEGLAAYSTRLEMMNAGHLFKGDEVAGIPDGMIERVTEGDLSVASLSTWGTLIWQRVRERSLGETLLIFPRLSYSKAFRRDFEHAARPERVELQACLAKVSGLLERNQGDVSVLKQDGGLLYENYADRHTQDHHAIGHFRINQRDRVSCTVEQGGLYLRRFGDHTVNENP